MVLFCFELSTFLRKRIHGALLKSFQDAKKVNKKLKHSNLSILFWEIKLLFMLIKRIFSV